MSAKNFSIMLVGLLLVAIAFSMGARPAEAQFVTCMPAPVYYAPGPAYYAPAPVYYAPGPAYYAPAPVYYAPAPVYAVARPMYVVPSYGSYGFTSFGTGYRHVYHGSHYYRVPRHYGHHGRGFGFSFGFRH